MYLNKKNNFNHGIMFHHFHDGKKHLMTQGSISQKKFIEIIKYIGRENIINPDEFFWRIKKNNTSRAKVCFTFDDAIKCQFDIAAPILNDFKIKAFFFIYTSIFQGKPDLLEIYRYFRINYFDNLNEFYENFFNEIKFDLNFYFKMHSEDIKKKKKKFPFYSILDIKFRIVRDTYLTDDEYNYIMHSLMSKKKFEYKKYFSKIFLNKSNVNKLHMNGHTIGLHSHSHPTRLEDLSFKKQYMEYKKNLKFLNLIIDDSKYKIKSMSHPCGSYNMTTLQILKELKIDLGFKQIMSIEKDRNMSHINNSSLEIARIDHALILRMLKKKFKKS